MSVNDSLSKFADLKTRLETTKVNQKAALESMGQTPGNDWATYPDLLRAASGGAGNYQTEKTASVSQNGVVVTPDEGYDGMLKVLIEGDPNFQPWNIVDGIEIWGKTGTMKLPTSTDYPTDLPVTEDEFFEELEQFDPEADTTALDYMVLADDQGNITYGYFMPGNGTMSYGGVELPALPEYDKSLYPYAVVVIQAGGYQYIVATDPYTTYLDSAERHKLAINGDGGIVYFFETSTGNWTIEGEGIGIGFYQIFADAVRWTNYDILNGSGSVYLLASDPVLSGFDITYYNPATTDFKATGWKRLSYHTTGENANTWTDDDFSTTESGGWNYLKNIRYCTREKLYYNGVEVWPDNTLDAITLSAGDSWYKGSTGNKTITEINLVDSYTPTGNETESWVADAAESGGIMCYIIDTTLIIAGNGSGRIYANADSGYAFMGFSGATSLNLSILNTSNVTTMTYMFHGCSGLTNLDLTSFDTSNVRDMSVMFYNCSGLTTLNISSFNTSKVGTMGHMFSKCSGLTALDLRNFDTSNAWDMPNMFDGCNGLITLDLTSFDTSNAIRMTYMFHNCSGLTQISVSERWDISDSSVTNMFKDCGVSEVTYI